MKKIIYALSVLFSISLYCSEISIIKLKGSVHYIRNDKVSPLTKETRIENQDIIRTDDESFLRFKIHDSLITLAPKSYFQIDTSVKKAKKIQANIGNLLYCHLYGNFIKEETNKKRVRIIKTKSASLGIRGTQILLHVTRDKKEYLERMSGKTHPLPTLEELTKLTKDPNLFSQICCIDGIIRAATKASKRVRLTEGQVLNYTSMGSEVKKLQFTKEQNLGSARRLGLLFD